MDLKIKGVEVLHRGVIYSRGQVICGVGQVLAADLMARGCAVPAEGGQTSPAAPPDPKAGGVEKEEPETLAPVSYTHLFNLTRMECKFVFVSFYNIF